MFNKKLVIDDSLKLKETKERREDRIERRANFKEGDDEVSDDSEEEPKEEVVAQKDKRTAKLNDNAKEAFTYRKLIEGLKEGRFKKICVLTGAGISVSAGIPDFRSPKTGLYANLEQYELPNPQAIFEMGFFNEKPQAFYKLATEFLDTDKFDPTPTHWFIRMLQDKGLLQINMT